MGEDFWNCQPLHDFCLAVFPLLPSWLTADVRTISDTYVFSKWSLLRDHFDVKHACFVFDFSDIFHTCWSYFFNVFGNIDSIHLFDCSMYSTISASVAELIKVVQRPSFIDFIFSFSGVKGLLPLVMDRSQSLFCFLPSYTKVGLWQV